MQTFLPYPCFYETAKCLDYRRLGKQRVEAKQIINTLTGQSSGWGNHPATLQWKGYENALKLYCNVMIEEWVNRGYKNTMELYEINAPIVMPPWYCDPYFHYTHRCRLMQKDFAYYSQFNWDLMGDWETTEYYWPSKGE